MQKKEVKPGRDITQTTQCILWGVAAGRCQFEGCNKPLWENSVTQEEVNTAQKAHIWSFSDDGPRGNDGIPADQLNSIGNLMLVCYECHKLIDKDKQGIKYSVQRLQDMKRAHEERINLAASIAPNKKTHILLYGANVGEHNSPVNYHSAAEALFPDYYPAERNSILLGFGSSPIKDSDDGYWSIERSALEKSFHSVLKQRLVCKEVSHVSVFALAPQPLLIQLGVLLSDIPDSQVYQRHREPQTWKWQEDTDLQKFLITEPESREPIVALNMSVTATIDNERIYKVLGKNVSIWTLTVPNPHNDFMRSRLQLREFRQCFRQLMNQIKAKHGHDQKLHIFPAVPVSVAVEVGRTWMPKADMRLCLYDEIQSQGGFARAFEL